MAERPLERELSARQQAFAERQAKSTTCWQDSLKLTAAAKPKAAPKAKAASRMTNYKWVIAFDHQWKQGCGHSLGDWLVAEPLARLPPSYVRVLVNAWDPEESRDRPRCFLKHDPSGFIRTSPELDVFARPAVHSSCDVGTIGNVGFNYLYYGPPHLNGTLTFDILHRFCCCWTDGVGAAGLHVQRLEMAIYAKFRTGPFNKDSCHDQMVACAKELVQLFPSHECLPWQLFYSRCAKERNRHLDAAFGSEEHSKELHAEVVSEMISEASGGSVRKGRWWNIEERADEALPRRGGDAMTLTHMGVKKKWWSSISASPLLRDDAQPMPVGPPPLESADEADDQEEGGDQGVVDDAPSETGCSLAKARKTIQEHRDESSGTLHFVARMLMNPVNMQLWTGLAVAARPFRVRFSKIHTAFSTRSGTKHMMDSIVMGDFIADTIADALNMFTSLDFAAELGVSVEFGLEPSEMNQKVLRCMWSLVMHTCGSLSALHGHYQRIPAKFLGLLRDDKTDLLAWHKRLWSAMNNMEMAAVADKKAAQALTDMGVFDLHWCRAILTNLFEYDFEQVSKKVEADIKLYANHFWTTLLLERGFNFCREASKQNKKGAFGAQAVWHQFVYGCDVMRDHERAPIVPTEVARAQSAYIDPRTFQPWEEDSAFPSDKLLPLTQTDQGGCRATSTQSLKTAPLALLGMVEEDGNWQRLQRSFFSLLVQPGDVLMINSDKSAHLVLYTSAKGCWVYKTNPRYINKNDIVIEFQKSGVSALRSQAICDHTQFRGVVVTCIHPGAHPGAKLPNAPATALLVASTAKPLIEHAADTGFRGMSLEFIKLCCRAEIVKHDGDPPRTENEWVAALVRHVYLGCSDERVQAAIVARGSRNTTWEDLKSSQLFEAGAKEWVEDIIGSEDLFADLRKEEEKAERHRVAMAKASTVAAPVVLGGAASSSSAPVPASVGPKKITCTKVVIGIVWARSLMPPSYSLVWEPSTSSWRIKSKYMIGGRSRAACPSTGETQWGALKFVLTLAWASYMQNFSVPCPFEFV